MVTMTARAREWEARVRAWERSGESAAVWCRANSVVVGTFSWWRWRLASRGTACEFVEVDVRNDVEPTPIEVELRSGRRVHVRAGFDAETLRCVVSALESY